MALTDMLITKAHRNPFVVVPWILGTLIPCVIFLIVHFSNRAGSETALNLKDAVIISGQPLPNSPLARMNGGNVAPEDLRKGKVLLVFLTTNCPACQKELRLLTRIAPRVSPAIKIYGVGIQDRNQLASFVAEQQLNVEILLDSDARLLHSLGVKYFPTKFLIVDGVIQQTTFGNSVDEAGLLKQLQL